MKRKYLTIPMGLLSCMSAISAEAALSQTALLAFDSGAPILDSSGFVVGVQGSYFSVDTNGDNVFSGSESIAISPGSDGGLLIGQTQIASIPTGLAGTVISPFDAPWQFLGEYGAHQSNSPVNIISDDGNGNVQLDFSGWGATWNGLPNIALGGDGINFSEAGIATLVCANDCSINDSFILDYIAHVPQGDPSGFDGVPWSIHLEGTVSAVPLPTAIWLFGGGLISLLSMSRRKSLI